MSKNGLRWAEMLDVLTDTERGRKVVVERATETERTCAKKKSAICN